MAAIIRKRLVVAVEVATAVPTAYYTAPALTRTLISKLIFTNTTAAAMTVSVWIGSAATDPNQVRDTKTVPPLDVFECYEAEGMVLEAGEILYAQASAATGLTIHLSGVEMVY